MIWWVLAGVVLVVVLGLVLVTVLDELSENHEGPGAQPYDRPGGAP